jgi:hypothetical protein
MTAANGVAEGEVVARAAAITDPGYGPLLARRLETKRLLGAVAC